VSMTNPTDQVDIITSVQRRRRWTASEKVRIVEETFEPGMTVSLVARRHGVAPNQLFTWRRLVAQGALTAAGSGEEVAPASDYRALQSRCASCNDCSARRRWKLRSSRRRSNTPRGQKNGCGCRRRRRRTVPDDDHGGGDWSLPLQSDRTHARATEETDWPAALDRDSRRFERLMVKITCRLSAVTAHREERLREKGWRRRERRAYLAVASPFAGRQSSSRRSNQASPNSAVSFGPTQTTLKRSRRKLLRSFIR
jgi:transposase-like protein